MPKFVLLYEPDSRHVVVRVIYGDAHEGDKTHKVEFDHQWDLENYINDNNLITADDEDDAS